MKTLFLMKEPLLAEGLLALLSKKLDELLLDVISSIHESELIKLVTEKNIQLVVLDTVSIGIPSCQLIQQLKKQPHSPRIILIYDCLSRGILSAYRSGMSGCFFRGDSLETISLAVQTVIRGEVYVPHVIIINLICEGHLFTDISDLVKLLSAKELTVLDQLCKGHRMKDIALRLSMAPSTLSTHKLRISQKLNLLTDLDFNSFLKAYEKWKIQYASPIKKPLY